MASKDFAEMNRVERQNLARAHFLKMATRNILGDEVPRDAGPRDVSAGPIDAPRDMGEEISKIKKMIKSQLRNLRAIVSLLPPASRSVDGLPPGHRKMRVNLLDSFKETNLTAQQSLAIYEDIQDKVLDIIKSPTTIRALSRNPEDWNKAVKEYVKVQQEQAKLNQILIQPTTPPLTTEAQKIKDIEDLKKDIKELEETMKEEEGNYDVLIEEEEAMRQTLKKLKIEMDTIQNDKELMQKDYDVLTREKFDDITTVERILEIENKQLEIDELFEKAGKDEEEKDNEINGLLDEVNAKQEEIQEKIDHLKNLQQELDTKKVELEVKEGKKGKGRVFTGGLRLNEYIYGHLHFTPPTKSKAKVIYDTLKNLDTEGKQTDELMETLTKDIFAGTPGILLAKGRFVERKFR